MDLKHIEIENLKVSPINVRKHGDKGGDNLVPSIKALGIIQPLLVRPNCEGFEVVAGQRRLNALQQIAKTDTVDPVPCVVMTDTDDAKAIEASLTENIVRLPMDEMNQYEAFLAMTKNGQTVSDIAAHFGVSERLVNQRLAIANLYAPIRTAYRNEDIDPPTIRLLTMASTRQQKEWFKLFKEDREPPHWKLKSWLFGGEEIPTENALFDLENYEGAITSNLFGEDSYFADAKLFWDHQSRAIAERKFELEEDGWNEVVLLDVGERWNRWDHVETSMGKDGKAYIEVRADGEVKIHLGLLPEKEAKRLALAESGEDAPKTTKAELTKSMQNYLALHRHAAVRVELLKHQGIALRLCVAQIIASTSLWDVRADRQRANTDAIKESLEASKAQVTFRQTQSEIMALLDIGDDTDRPLVDHRPFYGRDLDVHQVFAKLMTLEDGQVMDVLTYLVAETLESGSAVVEGLGSMLTIDMADHWSPDETFFDLLRDKDAINAMLKDISDTSVADGNLTATAKVQKQIIQDFLEGSNGRQKKADWHPSYMSFPMKPYTTRGGIGAIDQFKAVKQHYKAA